MRSQVSILEPMGNLPLLGEKLLSTWSSQPSAKNPRQGDQSHDDADGQQELERQPRERAHVSVHRLEQLDELFHFVWSAVALCSRR